MASTTSRINTTLPGADLIAFLLGGGACSGSEFVRRFEHAVTRQSKQETHTGKSAEKPAKDESPANDLRAAILSNLPVPIVSSPPTCDSAVAGKSEDPKTEPSRVKPKTSAVVSSDVRATVTDHGWPDFEPASQDYAKRAKSGSEPAIAVHDSTSQPIRMEVLATSGLDIGRYPEGPQDEVVVPDSHPIVPQRSTVEIGTVLSATPEDSLVSGNAAITVTPETNRGHEFKLERSPTESPSTPHIDEAVVVSSDAIDQKFNQGQAEDHDRPAKKVVIEPLLPKSVVVSVDAPVVHDPQTAETRRTTQTTPDLLPNSVEAAPHAETNESRSPVAFHSLRLTEQLAGPELRFAWHSAESGSIQLSTSLRQRDVQVTVSAEHVDTASAMRAELPSLDSRLHELSLRLGEVSIVAHERSVSAELGSAAQQHGRREWSANSAQPPDEDHNDRKPNENVIAVAASDGSVSVLV